MTANASKLAAIFLAGGVTWATAASAADENVMVVFDGSNSMWGQIDGTAKIEIARDVMNNLLGDWTEGRGVGLMAYGHRRRGDCSDIEMLVAPGDDTRAEILDRIGTITPTGKTPLTSAVEQAAKELSYADTPATVVLISDGLESCERDPCALAEALEQGGVGFTAHVVGFGLGGEEDAASLACIAEHTGGRYLSARNADELGDALSAVGAAVAAAPEPEPEPDAQPEPEPQYQVVLETPQTALAGAAFPVSWTGTVHADDYITIVAPGAEEGSYTNYFRVEDDSANKLRAPAETGLYEVRYVLKEGRRTLAAQPIEITEPEVTLSGPDKIRAGDALRVSWTGAVDGDDFITMVPMGTADGEYDDYFRVGVDSQHDITAPDESGLYELRYMLAEGRRVLARHSVEVLAANAALERGASLSAPATAAPGATIEVSWTVESDSADQRISLARADQAIFTWMSTVEAEGDPPLEITMPDEAGRYELRFIDVTGQSVLARKPIEVR